MASLATRSTDARCIARARPTTFSWIGGAAAIAVSVSKLDLQLVQPLSVKPGDSAQNILVGSLGEIAQSLPDYACRDKIPRAKDSSYSVSYEGGPMNARETQLDFKETRYIATEADCAIRGISDSTTCTAYVILSAMTKTNWLDLPKYNFYLFVPAHNVSYEKIKLKFTKVTWIWEQVKLEKDLNYTISFESSAIATVAKAAAIAQLSSSD